MALKTLPSGGMFIAGGIAPDLLWALKENDRFVNAFTDKGRMAVVNQKIPIVVVLDKSVGLKGSKALARIHIKRARLPARL